MSIVHPSEIADRYADQTAMRALSQYHDEPDDADDLDDIDSSFGGWLDSLGLSLEQLEALERAEQTGRLYGKPTEITAWECRSCQRLTENNNGACDSCLDDARSEHEAQREP
jgi:hypothetical protein